MPHPAPDCGCGGPMRASGPTLAIHVIIVWAVDGGAVSRHCRCAATTARAACGCLYTAFFWRNKKRLCPTYGTKACCFCDTTQIGVKNAHSLTRTIIRVPMDNGWEPVGTYWGITPVQAALGSPFAGCPASHFHRQGLSEALRLPGTSLRHRFTRYFLVAVIIRSPPGFVKPEKTGMLRRQILACKAGKNRL